jgi:hypothetical protein
VNPVATQFVKDELLPLDKVIPVPCPRTINGHDLAYNIALRMLFGDYVSKLTKHTSSTATCLGVDPVSMDWADVLKTAGKYNCQEFLAGDLSKQEATTQAVFAELFCQHLTERYSLTEMEINQFKNALAGLNGFYLIKDDGIYLTQKGHSSGHFLTTVFNSFMVWALHKLVFEDVASKYKFEDHVSLKVMGDDSIGSVTDQVRDLYNMEVISRVALKYGITYTGPKKGEAVPRFIMREDLTFLGRSFLVNGDMIVGALRKEAIHNMLLFKRKVTGMTPKEVIQDRTNNAFREATLWGKDFYTNLRSQMISSWSKSRLSPNIPSYSTALQKVMHNWYGSDRVTLSPGGPNSL